MPPPHDEMKAYIEIAKQYTPEQIEQAAIGMLMTLSDLAATQPPMFTASYQLRFGIAQALRFHAARSLGKNVAHEETLQLVLDTYSQAARKITDAAGEVNDAADELRGAVDTEGLSITADDLKEAADQLRDAVDVDEIKEAADELKDAASKLEDAKDN